MLFEVLGRDFHKKPRATHPAVCVISLSTIGMPLSQNPTLGVRSANQGYLRVSSNGLLSSEMSGKAFLRGMCFSKWDAAECLPIPAPSLPVLCWLSCGFPLLEKPMAYVHTAKPFSLSLFLCSVHCKPGDAYITTHFVCSNKDPIFHTIKSLWAAVIEKPSDPTREPRRGPY